MKTKCLVFTAAAAAIFLAACERRTAEEKAYDRAQDASEERLEQKEEELKEALDSALPERKELPNKEVPPEFKK